MEVSRLTLHPIGILNGCVCHAIVAIGTSGLLRRFDTVPRTVLINRAHFALAISSVVREPAHLALHRGHGRCLTAVMPVDARYASL